MAEREYSDPLVNDESVMFLSEAEDLIKLIRRKAHAACIYASNEPSKGDFTVLVQSGQEDMAFILYWTEFGKVEIELCLDGLINYFGEIPEYIYVSLNP